MSRESIERRTGRRAAGFAMLDVLGGIALLSVGLLGLAGATVTGTSAMKVNRENAQATRIAREAVERIQSIPQIEEVITTDTVERPSERRPPNLTVLSVGNVFAEAIRQNYLRRSIGELFEGMET